MAQLLQVEWLQTIKGDKYEQINAMAVAPSGDVYVVGFYQGNFSDLIATAEEDAFVAKYNEEGQLLWLRNLSSSSVDRFNGIAIANDQEIYLTGEFKGSIYNYSDSISSQNQLDMLLVKIDSSGTIQWLNSGSGLGYESGHSVSIAPNGSLMITGYFEQDFRIDSLVLTSNGLRDVFVASIDPITGQAQWLSSFGGLAIEQTQSIKADAANNTYVTGSFRDALFIGADTIFSKGSYDVFLAKYDGSGQLSWIKTFGGFGVDEGTYVNVDAAQNIYVSGWFNRSMFIDSMFLIGGQEDNAMLVKFNPAGDLLWVNDIGQNFDERAYAIDFDNQNNVYVLGTLDSFMILGQDTFTNRHVNRSTDIFLAKYNQEGDLFWARDMGYHFNDFCFDLYVQNQQNIYIVGSFQDSTIFLTDSLFSEGESYDIFVAKFGVDTTLTLDEKQGPLLNALQSNPNPSFGPWSLQYYLEKEALVEIRLTDYIGRTNNLLFKSFQQKGAQRLYFPRKQLYEGVYLIRLIVNQQSYTIKHVFR